MPLFELILAYILGASTWPLIALLCRWVLRRFRRRRRMMSFYLD